MNIINILNIDNTLNISFLTQKNVYHGIIRTFEQFMKYWILIFLLFWTHFVLHVLVYTCVRCVERECKERAMGDKDKAGETERSSLIYAHA